VDVYYRCMVCGILGRFSVFLGDLFLEEGGNMVGC
jgi:hypothetical protein